MSKLTKNLLMLSLLALGAGVAFKAGLVGAENGVTLFVVFPVGTVLFGLFMISKVLEKEAALYDQEQQAACARVQVNGRASVKACCEAQRPTGTMAKTQAAR